MNPTFWVDLSKEKKEKKGEKKNKNKRVSLILVDKRKQYIIAHARYHSAALARIHSDCRYFQ